MLFCFVEVAANEINKTSDLQNSSTNMTKCFSLWIVFNSAGKENAPTHTHLYPSPTGEEVAYCVIKSHSASLEKPYVGIMCPTS